MGSTRWNDDHYSARASHRATASVPTFAYSSDIATGKTAARVHPSLNPEGVGFRESRDSDIHPRSRAVSILLDVTGSMQVVPKIIQKNLPQLMGLLIRKSGLDSPQVLIGAIGDATCDRAPIQIGQFEAGIEIEDDLTNLYLEGGGGGSITESYELAMYFMAHHVQMDCLEKRSEKGFLFIIGDEIPYPRIKPNEVKKFIGDDLQGNISIESVVEELQKKFEVYFIIPKMTNNYDKSEITDRWKGLLGQNVLKLEDPAGVSELIATTVALHEGKMEKDEIENDLTDAGSSKAIAKAVADALVGVPKIESTEKELSGVEITGFVSGSASGITTL